MQWPERWYQILLLGPNNFYLGCEIYTAVSPKVGGKARWDESKKLFEIIAVREMTADEIKNKRHGFDDSIHLCAVG